MSSRDVERLLIERGVEVFYETVCRWVLSPQSNAEGGYFGPAIARNLQRLRPRPSPRWQLNEGERISGRHMYRCQAVDEGEVLDVLVQRRRYKAAARKLMRKLLNKHGFAPTQVTTDKPRPYGAAFGQSRLGSADCMRN